MQKGSFSCRGLPTSEKVLILVDFINPFDFPQANQILPETYQAAQATLRLKKSLSSKGIPTIYANDNYGTWHSNFDVILQKCKNLKGLRGEIAELLAPEPDDLIVLKPQHSAFHSTPLHHLLTQMKAKTLIITGVATDMCIMVSVTDACMLGYDVWVPNDCTAAESFESKNSVLNNLKKSFKCSIRKSTTNTFK
ncbi:isochorismatase family cysteine hydrolase [Comamonas sp. NoAH]|uniref:isochorismatase family cysteine hydrolase n=1 Tax=Comamonas halotolerans TaxID=3041496 RepID=UPI0024E15705|nr:isochorismatase family cysteine hydrolase [Comamonas sp. NoAH]